MAIRVYPPAERLAGMDGAGAPRTRRLRVVARRRPFGFLIASDSQMFSSDSQKGARAELGSNIGSLASDVNSALTNA